VILISIPTSKASNNAYKVIHYW